MQELPEDVDPACAGSFPALPREGGAVPPAPEPLARGSLPTLRPDAPRWDASVAAAPRRPPGPGAVHAAAQVQQFRRVGRWSPGLVALALLALVAGAFGVLHVL